MKKSNNTPMSIEELINFLRNNKVQGTTKVERTIRNCMQSNAKILNKIVDTTFVKKYDNKFYTSSFMYYKVKVIVCTFLDEVLDNGYIHVGSEIFLVNPEKNGLRYYTVPIDSKVLKFSLHFYNRLCERLLNNSDFTMSDPEVAAMCSVLDSQDYTISTYISDCYCLLKDNLVVYKKLPNEVIELVTFLGKPIGEEQTRIYNALMNYKLTTESLKKK